MAADYYWPHLEALKPYFGVESRIDTREKAFAFLVGVLIGALLHCRQHHDCSVFSQRRFPISKLISMTGAGLPSLHSRVVRELSLYSKSGKNVVKKVIDETSHLRTSLCNSIVMDETTTTYFLLYGISVSASVCDYPCEQEVDRCCL